MHYLSVMMRRAGQEKFMGRHKPIAISHCPRHAHERYNNKRKIFLKELNLSLKSSQMKNLKYVLQRQT